jgi:DNA-binding SARP family transcriptional activator/WD40 repeat protein
MGIAVLGPLTVDGNGARLAPRDRTVLAALVVSAGELVSAEQIADALWPESPPPTWRKVLQGSVVRLRKLLGPEAIETLPHGYRLVIVNEDVDAQQFQRLIRRAQELLTRGEPERAAFVIDEALALWRGRALSDLEDWETGRIEADRLHELRRDAQELRVDVALRTGHHREVLEEAQALVDEAPLRERRWSLLALAQYQSGRQSDALRTLQQVKAVLLTELGLDPGPDLALLEQAILRQDPALVAEVALPAPSQTCPYLGLLSYEIADADAYFGRERDVALCLQRLSATGVVAVVGPSGSGKSSLVRAGVAAALRSGGSDVVVITPGAHPMESITSLAGRSRPLVVDQCEEVATLCADPEEQGQFFAALAAHADSGQLVVALRADRLGDLSVHADFTRLVERGLFLLNPMTADDLRVAIEGPAQHAGLRLEPGLVDLLVREVEGEPGALPLLSHALRQSWQRREGATLTVEGYRATGGIRSSVAKSADALYERASPGQRRMLRDLLLRLVGSSPEGAPVRSRVPRRLVAVDAAHEDLIEELVAARLVTSDDGVVELAHEALARAWPRLRGWLDDDTEGQRTLRHLSAAADNWDAMGRPDSELYRGMRLVQAIEWRAAARPDLNPVEQAFLDTASRLARTEQQRAIMQARHLSRINGTLRALLVGVAFLLAAALVAGGLALRKADQAGKAEAAANQSARAADARRVGTQSMLTDDIALSLLLAVEGVRLDDSPDTRANLFAALSRGPQLIEHAPIPEGASGFIAIELSPDGRTLAALDNANSVTFYDTVNGSVVGRWDPDPGDEGGALVCVCSPLAFSPDGERLAVGMVNGVEPVVRLLDVATQELGNVQLGGLPETKTMSVPQEIEYTADGRSLIVTFDQSLGAAASAFVWDLDDPSMPARQVALTSYIPDFALSPDDRLLYHVPAWNAGDDTVTVFDVATGRRMASLGELGHPLVVSPDGATLAYADGNDVVLASATTGTRTARLRGHTGLVGDLAFSHTGEMLTSGSVEQGNDSAIVWRVSDGVMLQQVLGGASNVTFSPDDETLYTTGERGLFTWDLTGRGGYIPQTTRLEVPQWSQANVGSTQLLPSPRGDVVAFHLLAAPPLGLFKLLGVEGDRPVDVDFPTTASLRGLTWRPDGLRIAGLGDDGVLRVWDATSGELLKDDHLDIEFEFTAPALEYVGDGTRLLISDPSKGVLYTVDAETLDKGEAPETELGELQIVASEASPDKRTAIALTSDIPRTPFDGKEVRAWSLVDLRFGGVTHSGKLAGNASVAGFSPDGGRVAVMAGGLAIIDVASGRVRTAIPTGLAPQGNADFVNFSPDGSLVVSSDSTGHVSVWSGSTAEHLGSVRPGRLPSVASFLADGHTVQIVSEDGAVHTWDTRLNHAIKTACDIVRRNLTTEEWSEAFGKAPYRETCISAAGG